MQTPTGGASKADENSVERYNDDIASLACLDGFIINFISYENINLLLHCLYPFLTV